MTARDTMKADDGAVWRPLRRRSVVDDVNTDDVILVHVDEGEWRRRGRPKFSPILSTSSHPPTHPAVTHPPPSSHPPTHPSSPPKPKFPPTLYPAHRHSAAILPTQAMTSSFCRHSPPSHPSAAILPPFCRHSATIPHSAPNSARIPPPFCQYSTHPPQFCRDSATILLRFCLSL